MALARLFAAVTICVCLICFPCSVSLAADANPAPALVLQGHTDGVASLDFSPDSRLLVSGSFDRSMRLWDTATGKEAGIFKFDHFVVVVAFSPDGNKLLSVERDNTVRLWDARTARQLWRSKDISGDMIMAAGFSPDGRFIATSNSGGAVCLWDAEKGKLAKTLKGNGELAMPLLFSKDGRYLLAGTDKSTTLWDVTEGVVRQEYKNPYQRSPRAISPDGRHLLYRSEPQEKLIIDRVSGKTMMKIAGDFRAFHFSPDAGYIASGNAAGILSVAEFKKNTTSITFSAHAKSLTALAFSPDGKYLASGGLDKAIKIWNFGSLGTVAGAPAEFIVIKTEAGVVSIDRDGDKE